MTESTLLRSKPVVPPPPASLLKKYPWIFKGVVFQEEAPIEAVEPGQKSVAAGQLQSVSQAAPAEKTARVRRNIGLHASEYWFGPISQAIPSSTPVVFNTSPKRRSAAEKATTVMTPAVNRAPAVSGINRVGFEMIKFFTMTAPKNGLTKRDGQIQMAEAVLNAIKNKTHLLTEAGVGIGKSYGYLVPVLLYHKETKAPVVIATSTIALQEQLAADMKRLLPMLGMKESFYVAKGQGNYLCSEKVHKLAIKSKDSDTVEGIGEILEELRRGHTDRRDLEIKVDDQVWKRVCIENYSAKTCSCCVYSSECEYHKMRSRLLTAGITICNQSLLAAHLINMERGWPPLLNPKTGIVVVDEAHNLENNVRMSGTQKFSLSYILRMATNANFTVGSKQESFLDDNVMDQIDSTARTFFANIEMQAKIQAKQSSDRRGLTIQDGKMLIKKEADRFFFRDEDGAYKLLSDLSIALKAAASSFWDEEASHGRNSKDNSIGQLVELGNKLSNVVTRMENYIFWIEVENKQFQLCYCQKDIAERVQRLFFDRDHISIMTSATMTGTSEGRVEDKYAYFIRNTGYPLKRSRIGEHCGKLCDPIASPFDYNHHAMIYHADDLPHPTRDHEAFICEGTKRLKEILDISEGRALVLFTSKEDMRAVYEELRKQHTGYRVLMQKAGSSQAKILQKFKEDEHAVLLGTGSYWEGISIEGSTLSNVVIFRLPFPVPDPISTSREEGCKDPLMEVRVPDMVIKLKQGVGRLIRNETDKGIISILDSRLSESSTVPYKEIVWNSLPIKNRTANLNTIRAFYNEKVAAQKKEEAAISE